MLCPHCKKNQATKSYRRIKNGNEEVEYYCLTCYERKVERVAKTDGAFCPYCGTTAEEAKKRNIVGCAMCYGALREVLQPIVTKFQGGNPHTGKGPTVTKSENIRRRCYELKALAEKLNADGDFDGARAYLEILTAIQSGKEEEFVWRKHPPSYKR